MSNLSCFILILFPAALAIYKGGLLLVEEHLFEGEITVGDIISSTKK